MIVKQGREMYLGMLLSVVRSWGLGCVAGKANVPVDDAAKFGIHVFLADGKIAATVNGVGVTELPKRVKHCIGIDPITN